MIFDLIDLVNVISVSLARGSLQAYPVCMALPCIRTSIYLSVCLSGCLFVRVVFVPSNGRMRGAAIVQLQFL